MPEGDTIHRTADTLRRWLVGREVTAARSPLVGVPVGRLVGERVQAVEARGKHLLVRAESGLALHTHLGMTGSWHVYAADQRWRRPERQARLVVEAGDRVAVCFNAPVVELLDRRAELAHPSLGGLGPDLVAGELDAAAVRERARRQPPDTPIGELLLDQRVAAGIGNVYRCEALFLARLHPSTPVGAVADDHLDEVFATAARLLRGNLRQSAPRDTGLGPGSRWVYGRAGRPCRRCRTTIVSRRQGEHARTVTWCPACQPPPSS